MMVEVTFGRLYLDCHICIVEGAPAEVGHVRCKNGIIITGSRAALGQNSKRHFG